MDQATANRQAGEIRGRAATYKRDAELNRRRARREMRRLEKFTRMCAEFGITVILEDNESPSPERRPSDRDSREDDRF